MLEKIIELANKEKEISDFHLRGESDIAYRMLGDIIIEPDSKIEEKDLQFGRRILHHKYFMAVAQCILCYQVQNKIY